MLTWLQWAMVIGTSLFRGPNVAGKKFTGSPWNMPVPESVLRLSCLLMIQPLIGKQVTRRIEDEL